MLSSGYPASPSTWSRFPEADSVAAEDGLDLDACSLLRRVGGERDGQYVGLDFGHLKIFASLDRTLRYVLLPMTLDVELFARTKLVREVTERPDEDGYSVVSDYLAALDHDDRRRRMGARPVRASASLGSAPKWAMRSKRFPETTRSAPPWSGAP